MRYEPKFQLAAGFAALAAVIVFAGLVKSAPPCEFAWASAIKEQKAAAFAWATSIAPAEVPIAVTPPKTLDLVSVKGWHFPKANEISEPGHHWHRCACGRVCQHGDEHHGDLSEHTCVCGRVNFDKVPGIAVKKIAVPGMAKSFGCPDGNCPRQ